MQSFNHQSFGLGLGLIGSLLIGTSSVAANPAIVASSPPPQVFTTPTYDREPLPKALNTAQAWQTVAHNAMRDKDYHNSLVAYNKAIDLAFPEQRALLLEERGWVYYLSGYFNQASQDLQRAASLYLDQEDRQSYRNVIQMRRFIDTQARQLQPTPRQGELSQLDTASILP
ncbi:tetratricopeptide repeat protein [Lyngbya confervoides]|uniref:Tetratricopeptide repeat protein n=1 Tax=Lyngbya confervoides BDU141951 TaxID=1574623 RepID=A0ABD4SZ48_9CYAN|nr:tetratricopeptide repeat protein [Lyngbya confervoides]MCM1981574.1 hypothetical protein [Lyngbya confervoides BDU141951]